MSGKPLPYRFRTYKKYFTVHMGTIHLESPIPLRKWVIAIYLVTTNLKGVSSIKLHRDLDISQSTVVPIDSILLMEQLFSIDLNTEASRNELAKILGCS